MSSRRTQGQCAVFIADIPREIRDARLHLRLPQIDATLDKAQRFSARPTSRTSATRQIINGGP